MKSSSRQMINEQLPISESSPIKARFYDYAHFTYPWHFHAEYEIIYFKEGTGTGFIGNNMESFKAGDFILIGSNLPHYMKNDDAYYADGSCLRTKGTIIQFEHDFMQYSIRHYIQFTKIKKLLDDSLSGIYFPAGCSAKAVELLETIPSTSGIEQILSILNLFKEMTEISSKVIFPPSEKIRQRQDTSLPEPALHPPHGFERNCLPGRHVARLLLPVLQEQDRENPEKLPIGHAHRICLQAPCPGQHEYLADQHRMRIRHHFPLQQVFQEEHRLHTYGVQEKDAGRLRSQPTSANTGHTYKKSRSFSANRLSFPSTCPLYGGRFSICSILIQSTLIPFILHCFLFLIRQWLATVIGQTVEE